MEWAKLRSAARFNLATSGMRPLTLAELGVKTEQLEINGPSIYGYDPLLKAIAERYRVPQSSVVSAIGTSMANYLAMAAMTEPGQEILVEHPGYEPIVSTAEYLRLQVRRFERPAALNYAVELDDLEQKISERTRMIVITNLHNPSGAYCSETELREIANIARSVGAYVLVDEVYREMLFEAEPLSAFHIDPERMIVTNSLTKAYGLSGVRCGWILAQPKWAERMWHINDLHGATFAHPAELLSVIAFERLTAISAIMKSTLDANRKLLHEFLAAHDQLQCYWPDYGTIVFPRLRSGDAEEFCTLLRERYETAVVPGRFFDTPDRFRIGVGLPTQDVGDALRQLGRALEEVTKGN